MHIYLKLLSVCSVICITVLSSCYDDDLQGYDQPINPLWEYNYNVGLSGTMTPILYEDKVMFSPNKEITPDFDSNEKLMALDKNSGDVIWEWSDFFNDTYSSFSGVNPKYLYYDIIAFTIGASNYAVDLNTGQTIWRNWRTSSFANMVGQKNLIYRIDGYRPADIGEYVDQLMEADIYNGEWEAVFEISGGDSLKQGLTVPAFYNNKEGENILAMGNSSLNEKHNETEGYVTPYLIGYNKTTQQVEYNVQLDEPGLTNRVDWHPQVYNDKVYVLVGNVIACHDAETGERIWASPEFNGDFLFSGMLIADDRIYANRDGGDPTLYCIDPENGNIIWQKPSAGTSSPLQYHKGVLYFVGGSTGKFHIVNAANGETIHKITAPSEYRNSNDFFHSTGCVVDPEEDKVYVSSQSTAYCYPTVEL